MRSENKTKNELKGGKNKRRKCEKHVESEEIINRVERKRRTEKSKETNQTEITSEQEQKHFID